MLTFIAIENGDKGVSALGMRGVNRTRRVDEDEDEGINAKRRKMQ